MRITLGSFLGCTNWIRWFLHVAYPAASKILTDFLKPGSAFPPGGFGQATGKTQGDKAVKGTKMMAVNHIENSTIDEASALDGAV